MIQLMTDDTWEQLGREITHRGTIYDVRYRPKSDSCPICNASSLSRRGWTRSVYVDAPIGHEPTILRVKAPRLVCGHCERAVSQRPEGFLKRRRMTKRCGDFILEARYRYTFTEIAKMTGLHRTTVARLLTDKGRAKLEAELAEGNQAPSRFQNVIKPYVPEEIAIDEIYLSPKRGLITIIDREFSRLVGVLEANKANAARALKEFFDTADNILRHPDGDIEVIPDRVTMDMCRVYRRFFYKKFPNTKIVVDRWHVEKLLGKRFETILKDKKKWLAISSRTSVAFGTTPLRPRENDVLFTKFAEISVATEEQSDGLLPRESLRQLLLGYPHIISAWEHWQRFNEIWLSKTEKQAETQFIAWLASIPDEFPGFKKFGKELELWNKEFLNYFDWKRATNGTAEWINNIIRRCYSRYKRNWKLQDSRG